MNIQSNYPSDKDTIVAIKEFKDWVFKLPKEDIRIKREVEVGRSHSNKHLLKVYELFREINEEFGNTIIVITHERRVAEKTDRIIEIRDGRIHLDLYK